MEGKAGLDQARWGGPRIFITARHDQVEETRETKRPGPGLLDRAEMLGAWMTSTNAAPVVSSGSRSTLFQRISTPGMITPPNVANAALPLSAGGGLRGERRPPGDSDPAPVSVVRPVVRGRNQSLQGVPALRLARGPRSDAARLGDPTPRETQSESHMREVRE
jgi:hypothetical protein